MIWFGVYFFIFIVFGSVEYDVLGKNISKVGGVCWGFNNYYYDYFLFVEYISNRLVIFVGFDEREYLVKKWEDVMIYDLDFMRWYVINIFFGDGEMYENF